MNNINRGRGARFSLKESLRKDKFLCISSDFKKVISIRDNELILWDTFSKTNHFYEILKINDNPSPESNVDATFSKDSTRLAVCVRYTAGAGDSRNRSPNAAIHVFELRKQNKTIFTISNANVFQPTFSPDGKRLAVRSRVDAIIFDLESGEKKYTEGGRYGDNHWFVDTSSLTFSPDGTFIVTGAGDSLRVWDTTRYWDYENPYYDPNENSESNEKSLQSNEVGRFSVPLGLPSVDLTLSEDSISLAYSPDGKTLASGHANGVISLLKVTDNRNIYSDRTKDAPVGGEDDVIRLDNLFTIFTNDTIPTSFIGFYRGITTLSFSPDGKKLASVGIDLKLWNVEDGSLIDSRLVSLAYNTREGFRSVLFYNQWVIVFYNDGIKPQRDVPFCRVYYHYNNFEVQQQLLDCYTYINTMKDLLGDNGAMVSAKENYPLIFQKREKLSNFFFNQINLVVSGERSDDPIIAILNASLHPKHSAAAVRQRLMLPNDYPLAFFGEKNDTKVFLYLFNQDAPYVYVHLNSLFFPFFDLGALQREVNFEVIRRGEEGGEEGGEDSGEDGGEDSGEEGGEDSGEEGGEDGGEEGGEDGEEGGEEGASTASRKRKLEEMTKLYLQLRF